MFALKKKSLKSDMQIASVQEKCNALMWQIKKWQGLQLLYMPGVTTPLQAPEDNTKDNDLKTTETVPLFLPSNLDPARRERICLHHVAEHEQLLHMAHIQDSLAELRHARKICHRLLVNHYTQIAGQGKQINTRSRTVLNSIESRISKFVERYRIAYNALLQLDPDGDWRETYLELKDSDNRGPGKESNEDGPGDGSYFCSWIWLSNPRALDATDVGVGEEGASEEDVNELLHVEWTTSFARLERWAEEVELLQEEMQQVVMFLEWKSRDWLMKADARQETSTLDIQSGLNAYARKQAAVYHDLVISFVTSWWPTLVSYRLQHSWATDYMTVHGVSLTGTNVPASQACGIFKFRLLNKPHGTASIATSDPSYPSDSPMVEAADANDHPLLEEANYRKGSNLEDSDSDLVDFLDDDMDF